MTHMRFALGLLFVLGLVAAAAGVSADGSRLAVGDVIMVTVDGEKDFTKEYQINSDGCITLPMNIPPVKLEGLNTSEAAAELTKALKKVLVNPQVTVAFLKRASMHVFVVGQVKRTGLVEIGVGDRVLQALAQAGYDETSDLSRVNVRRGNQIIDLNLKKYLSGEDLTQNIELQSGDTVVVPRADIEVVGSVLITGQVNKTGTLPLKKGMTFREAMGLVGGVTVEADTDRITIKRENYAEPIKIDYKRAMEGDKTADIELQPGDVIFVPEIETAFFTLMGAVNRPGQYPIKGKLTLSEAIGAGGGPVPQLGDLRKVQIVRAAGPDGKPGETVWVDLTKIHEKGEPEPIVRRGDVITVGAHKQGINAWEVIRTILPFAWIFR
ncbi:MAG: SLBB domain-containing protein [Armatimonadota bacterium]|nr:SLBB domain-containing protein [Armatimonadota bacterium]